jgi:hypothetical protein
MNIQIMPTHSHADPLRRLNEPLPLRSIVGELRNTLVMARGVRPLDITYDFGIIRLWDNGKMLFETEDEREAIAFLRGILSFDTREAFALAIVEARENVSYDLAKEIVTDILGKPSIAQMVRGL